MDDTSEKNLKKITVTAPPDSDSTISGAVLSVEIGVDEQVVWEWTHFENGKKAVTGYQIIKKEKSNGA
jgi:hypothetical protein